VTLVAVTSLILPSSLLRMAPLSQQQVTATTTTTTTTTTTNATTTISGDMPGGLTGQNLETKTDSMCST